MHHPKAVLYHRVNPGNSSAARLEKSTATEGHTLYLFHCCPCQPKHSELQNFQQPVQSNTLQSISQLARLRRKSLLFLFPASMDSNTRKSNYISGNDAIAMEFDVPAVDEDTSISRRTAMDALERNVGHWRELPDRFRRDKEFILRALQAPRLPAKSDFERFFPQSLRFDRDVVLAFCARPDFAKLYKERHLYVPECLKADKEVMLAYCTKIPRSLQECSEELCDDADIVHAAISLDGLELQYASMRLQQDKETVVKACQKDGKALEFCPEGPTLRELTHDRNFMLQVLRQHGGPMLRLVPDFMKQDRELLLEALKHGMRFRFCPFEYQNQIDFLLEALSQRSELYLEMNRTLQAEHDIAYAALISESATPPVIEKVLLLVPSLKSQRCAAVAIVKHGAMETVHLLVNQDWLQPRSSVKDDEELMLLAIRRDPKLFSFCSPRLKQRTPIIMAAIDEESAGDVLAAVGAETLQDHPEIVVRAIEVFTPRHLRILRSHIPEALWTNRQVVAAWIRKSGRVLDVFEPLIQNDEELALIVASHAWNDFHRVGPDLRNSYDFMLRAVDENGWVIRYAGREIREDMTLLIRAIANTGTAMSSLARVLHVEGHAQRLREQVTNHVQSKLDLHKLFVGEFLRGIAIVRPHVPPARRSPLAMLDRGVETSQALKQLIAEFLGVPVQEELGLLRRCFANMNGPEANIDQDAAMQDRPEILFLDRLHRRRAQRGERVDRAMRMHEDRLARHRQRIRAIGRHAGAGVMPEDPPGVAGRGMANPRVPMIHAAGAPPGAPPRVAFAHRAGNNDANPNNVNGLGGRVNNPIEMDVDNRGGGNAAMAAMDFAAMMEEEMDLRLGDGDDAIIEFVDLT